MPAESLVTRETKDFITYYSCAHYSYMLWVSVSKNEKEKFIKTWFIFFSEDKQSTE